MIWNKKGMFPCLLPIILSIKEQDKFSVTRPVRGISLTQSSVLPVPMKLRGGGYGFLSILRDNGVCCDSIQKSQDNIDNPVRRVVAL